MKITDQQTGFSVVELVLIIVVIVAVVLVYGLVVQKRGGKTGGTANQSAAASDVGTAPTISTVNDLDKAQTILDKTDPNGSNNTDSTILSGQVSNI